MSFYKLESLEEKEIVPGFKARMIHSEKMTVAYWSIDEGAALPEHSHPHEQVTSVLAGQFEMNVNGEVKLLSPGVVAVIPSNTPHSGKALTHCHLIDSFSPAREDYQ